MKIIQPMEQPLMDPVRQHKESQGNIRKFHAPINCSSTVMFDFSDVCPKKIFSYSYII